MFRLWKRLFGWDYVLLSDGQICRVRAPRCPVHKCYGCPYIEPRAGGRLYLTGQERDIAWVTCDPWDYRQHFSTSNPVPGHTEVLSYGKKTRYQ